MNTNKWFEGWRFALLLLVVALIARLPTLFCGFYNPDETYYATIGQRLLEGGTLYSSIIDHKPPIIYYLYSFFVLMGGQNAIIVAHAANVFVVTATASVIHLILCYTNSNRQLGGIAALLYVVGASLGKPNDVAAANAELFFNLPLSLHILFAIKSLHKDERGRYINICASGFAAAIAVLVKLHAAAVPVATLLYLLLMCRKTAKIRSIFFVYIISFMFPFLLLAALYYHTGSLRDAWYWMVEVNFLYMQGHEEDIHLVVRFFKQTAYLLLLEGSALWLPIMFWVALRKKGEFLLEGQGALVKSWLFASAIAVFPGGRFFGHYYLQLLPPACILGTAAIFKLMEKYSQVKGALKIIVISLMLIPFVHSWFWALPIRSFRSELEIEEFSKVIDYLKNNARKNEKVEVWGKFNGIPFLVGRENGSRFLSKHFLAGSYRGKELVKMPGSHWMMYFSDLEKNRPEWFVDISSTNMPNAPIAAFPALSSYLAENYTLTTQVESYNIYHRKKF